MNLQGKKTYIAIIAALLTILMKKLGVETVGVDLSLIADEILMGLMTAAMFTKQQANSREKLLAAQVDFQKALLSQRSKT